MKKYLFLIPMFISLVFSCNTYELTEAQKINYTTSGALSNDCFQIIITVPPDREFKTMAEQRENAFIKAKNSLIPEIEKQVLLYYSAAKPVNIGSLSQETLNIIKDKSSEYSKQSIIEQEYYLIDNSAVLVYRIFKKGIKNEILDI